MTDEGLLKRLMHYMMNDSVKLQMAATYCVSNLVWSTEERAVDRQQKLRDLGVQKLLQSLLTTSDVNLFDRCVDRSCRFNQSSASCLNLFSVLFPVKYPRLPLRVILRQV